MKKQIITAIFASAILAGCNFLDTKYEVDLTSRMIESDYSRIAQLGQGIYAYVQPGFWELDGNFGAARSDEAVQTRSGLSVQLYNNGGWNDITNPENYLYDNFYKGIRSAHYFLDYSRDYREMLRKDRDIISDGGAAYLRDVSNVEWFRAEAHVALAYYYFELLKRYGEVPLIKGVLDENTFLPRSPYDEVLKYITDEIDYSLDSLRYTWYKDYGGVTGDRTRDGRFTVGAALALKSRALLYAASPLNNPQDDGDKWKAAAKAAHDVIDLGMYSLAGDYSSLFLTTAALESPETIMMYRNGATNDPETLNYPVGTPGGASGITPSENLAAAYEYKSAPDPANRYVNLDPRFYATIVYNGSTWNGRTIDISAAGQDSYLNSQSSRTGYYLRKFLAPNLYLVQGDVERHVWPIFRYAEILLNYAEAMNEAYGPDDKASYSMTAKEALNLVRQRSGVGMPAVATSDPDDFRRAVKHERRIELAFEGHRYWDLVRWKDGAQLAADIKGIRATNGAAPYTYQEIKVESRVFDAPRMYRYPFPYYEVARSGGVLVQNTGW